MEICPWPQCSKGGAKRNLLGTLVIQTREDSRTREWQKAPEKWMDLDREIFGALMRVWLKRVRDEPRIEANI